MKDYSRFFQLNHTHKWKAIQEEEAQDLENIKLDDIKFEIDEDGKVKVSIRGV